MAAAKNAKKMLLPATKNKLIIHGGMPKTGSTAIQHFFNNYEDNNFKFINLWSKDYLSNLKLCDKNNQSIPFSLMFDNNVDQTPFYDLVTENKEFNEVKSRLRNSFVEQISAISNNNKTPVFSAETLCTLDKDSIRDAFLFMQNRSIDYNIWIYIRYVDKLISSLFAHYVEELFIYDKLNSFSVIFEYIKNIKYFETINDLLTIVGDSVSLISYNTNIIQDFWGRLYSFHLNNIGYSVLRGKDGKRVIIPKNINHIPTLNQDTNFKKNISLSLEGIRIIYLYLKLNNGKSNLTPYQRMKFINLCKKLPKIKIRPYFSKKFINQIIDNNINNIENIENRLGHTIRTYDYSLLGNIIKTEKNLEALHYSTVEVLCKKTNVAYKTSLTDIDHMFIIQEFVNRKIKK